MSNLPAHQWRERALSAERSGDPEAARQAMRDGLEQHPGEAPLWNSAGSLYLRLGDGTSAEKYFEHAATLEPENIEFTINRAIALSAIGRHSDALTQLDRFADRGRSSAFYCSTRGTAERGVGNAKKAAFWYDLALALEPGRAKALHGRARVALERAEAGAVQRFDRALAANNADADLWLGKAQSLDVAGDQAGARQIAQALVDQAPQWIEGLKFLAQLRLGAGEEDFTSHFGEAAKRVPQDPNVPSAWATALAGLDHNEQAAEIAAHARCNFPNIEEFALFEAMYCGAAGDDERAEAIFADLSIQSDDRWLHEARHRIRRKQFDLADGLIEQVLKQRPDSISAWALRGVIWRMVDDPRSAWLSEQVGLVRLLPLEGGDAVLRDVIPLLHRLHDGSPLPLGQSLRGGTQTRGILFDRIEPELAALKAAIERTIARYRSELPSADEKHPLLRHRDAEWQLAGSWSVRLSGGGDFHTAHIHPQGIVSSALYLEVPKGEQDDPKAGWLEIGRPAHDLKTGLEPITIIEPKPGNLALFPSTLYHGTRPFTGSRRMTVAFDAVLRQSWRS